MAVSPSGRPQAPPSSPNQTEQQQNNDFFFRTYGPKQDSSSIAVPNQLAISSKSEHHITTTNTTIDSDNNLCFPQRLFRMLNKLDMQFEHLSHIISWHESGMGFLIHDPECFVKEVMPVFFRSQTKLTSFQRQLNNYGFQRVQERKNIDGLTYYHKHFMRDDPEECRNVELKRCKMASKKCAAELKKRALTTTQKEKKVEEERLSLLLKIMPKLNSKSKGGADYNALSKKIKDSVILSTAPNVTPPITSALSLFTLLNEGDRVLDEAANAIYDKAHGQILQEQPSTIPTRFYSAYAASFWDTDVEAFGFAEGI